MVIFHSSLFLSENLPCFINGMLVVKKKKKRLRQKMKWRQMDWAAGIKNNDSANDDFSFGDLEHTFLQRKHGGMHPRDTFVIFNEHTHSSNGALKTQDCFVSMGSSVANWFSLDSSWRRRGQRSGQTSETAKCNSCSTAPEMQMLWGIHRELILSHGLCTVTVNSMELTTPLFRGLQARTHFCS